MSATEPKNNPVDVTDHHHHHQNLNNDHHAIISTTSEIVEMKNNLPIRRIDNNSVITTTTTNAPIQNSIIEDGDAVLNNDINQNQKTNWVQFDDDDNSNNNNTMINQQQQQNNTVNNVGVGAAAILETSTINANNNSNKITKKSDPLTIATVDVTTTTNNSTTINKGIAGPLSVQANSRLPQKPIQEITPAVLSHVNLNIVTTSPQSSTTAVSSVSKNVAVTSTSANSSGGDSGGGSAQMRTIELSTGRVREGFANGDIIVTLLPTNSRWPWVTPAVFRPELVPEELMAQGLTLTVEEYVNAMETLVNDYRFTIYNICYKRVLVCWIVFAFCVLLTLLFSGLKGIALFSLGVGWLFLNAAAIFFCMWIKLRLSRGLEKCLARVNKLLIRHKIILILDDRGRISCHKVNLCFLYFDPSQCIAYLNDYIEKCEQNGTNIQSGWESRLDVDINDIVIQGSNPVRLSRKQAIATEIFLSYLQRWGKDFLRRRLDWTVNEAGVHEIPRHLMSSICPCQYHEEILNNKIKLQNERSCCTEFFHNSFRNIC